MCLLVREHLPRVADRTMRTCASCWSAARLCVTGGAAGILSRPESGPGTSAVRMPGRRTSQASCHWACEACAGRPQRPAPLRCGPAGGRSAMHCEPAVQKKGQIFRKELSFRTAPSGRRECSAVGAPRGVHACRPRSARAARARLPPLCASQRVLLQRRLTRASCRRGTTERPREWRTTAKSFQELPLPSFQELQLPLELQLAKSFQELPLPLELQLAKSVQELQLPQTAMAHIAMGKMLAVSPARELAALPWVPGAGATGLSQATRRRLERRGGGPSLRTRAARAGERVLRECAVKLAGAQIACFLRER